MGVNDAELLRRVTVRLALVLGFCSFFNTLDRLNISFAALQMNQDLGLSPAAFGAAVGAFFWPYMVLEAPSNLALQRVGARRWLTGIVAAWAVVSMATALVHDAHGLTVARLLLGVAEAGFLPAVLYVSAEWLPAGRRGTFMGAFAMWSVAASMLGAPLASALLALDDIGGMDGWRWLFLMEGVPSLLLAGACWRLLADRPDKARWLSLDEQRRLQQLVAADEPPHVHGQVVSWRSFLTDRRLLILMALFFATNFTVYGLSYWMPLVFRSVGYSDAEIGWLATLPGLVGCVSMVLWSRRSDRRNERFGHLAAPMFVAGLGTAATGLAAQAPVLAVAAMCVAVAGVVSAAAVLWILPALLLPPRVRAVGVGLAAAAGASSGLVSPWLVGMLKERTGDFTLSLVALGVPIMAASLLPLLLRRSEAPAPAAAGLS